LGDKAISYRAVVGSSSREAASSVRSKLKTVGRAGCWVAVH
jgi:hypothetical protein